MDHAKTCWAEGLVLPIEQVEALTLVSEESARRGGERRSELDPHDVDSWPAVLEESSQLDLAERVRQIRSVG